MEISEAETPRESETTSIGYQPDRRSIMGRILTGEAGRPVVRGAGSEGRKVPGATLSPQRRIALHQALEGIRLAETAVHGNDVITVVLPPRR